jgi:2-polyprenyl-3-methyl-5-hydroxy-6-metoxy-1,4-benzoquinol methylase
MPSNGTTQTIPVLRMSANEFGHDYYDRLYQRKDVAGGGSAVELYRPLYRAVLLVLQKYGLRAVLEVGCGAGDLAEMIIAKGIGYSGFDFSPKAIEKARQRNASGNFFVADAASPASYQTAYDGIVCCEVLEHIDADLSVVDNWRPGSLCICSVPNFGYESHVRYFRSEQEVVSRYGRLIDIRDISRLASSPSAGLTWPEYLRRIRWARNQPKRLLGILGINRFDWFGGWFVFAGRRR